MHPLHLATLGLSGADSRTHPADSVRGNPSNEGIYDGTSAPTQQTAVSRVPGRLETLTEPGFLSSKSFRIAIKTSDRILLIDSSDVIAVEAQGNYVLLHRQSNSLRVRGSISALAKELEPRGFIRIHRSVLLNASFVQEIRQSAAGEFTLCRSGGREYRVSRACRNNLKAMAQVWIGASALSEK
jgi:DNA-binding LytR/AlgR family response regulator